MKGVLDHKGTFKKLQSLTSKRKKVSEVTLQALETWILVLERHTIPFRKEDIKPDRHGKFFVTCQTSYVVFCLTKILIEGNKCVLEEVRVIFMHIT